MTETLTDEERAHLRLYDRRGEKALRIIDQLTEALAPAEERAYSNAAVARDEIASSERMSGLLAAAEARVRELTERVSRALAGLRPGSPVREALEEALRAP